jgi:hypothetical protein
VPVPPVPDVRSEEGHCYPQLLDAVELVLASSLAVFDPVAVIRARRVREGHLVRVENRTYRGIPVAVRPHLPTGRVDVGHRPVQLFLAPYDVVIRWLGLAEVGLS